MKRIYSVSLLIAACLMILSSCEKDPKSSGDHDYSGSQDQAFAENTLEDVDKIADQGCDDLQLTTYRIGSGSNNATVTLTTSGTTKTVTIDFGATEVTCMDGKRRKGKIIVTFTGNYRDANGTHTITFENYFVNDYKVEGSRQVTNNGKNADNQTVFSVTSAITIHDANGKSMTWNSTRTRTWVEGESTTYLSNGIDGIKDDAYDITGSATGSTFDGNSFTATIIQPLRIMGECRWIIKGVLEFTPDGKTTRTVDYGDGTQDNVVTVTINGVGYTVMIS